MCFTNVDCQELHAFVILLIEISETDGPFDVGRSGEATEDQHHWFTTLEVRETNRILTVHIEQLEIWSDVPNFGRKSIEPLLPGTIFSLVLSTVSARYHFFSDIEQ